MARTGRDLRIRPGAAVFGRDGDKVGTVVAVRPDHVVVEKGWLARTRYRVPNAAIAGYADGGVYLNVAKTAVFGRGWDAPPP